MPITQAYRRIGVASPLGEDVLVLQRMTATEGLSELFEFQLDLLSENGNIELAELLGQNMTVRLALPDGGTRYFNGFVSGFCHRCPQARYVAYQATLRPWLWFLTRTADCRIFQNQTVPDIIKTVFQERGFADFEENLSESYRTWEYCVQYRETDFNFVSRLLEQEGIYYYFKHDNGRHTLVLADSSSAHEAITHYEQLPYWAGDLQNLSGRECIFECSTAQQLQSGVCALNDFDFQAPKKSLHSKRALARSHAHADFEVYDYPGGYEQSADGEKYVRLRIEEVQAHYERLQGQSNAHGLTVGALFKLVDCPREDQNREYLVVTTTHHVQSNEFAAVPQLTPGEECTCSFTALDAQQPFRPPRLTPKPLIQGPQTAIVVGKAGEEIWTDQYGRVKVQFHWDRDSKADETSSCWVRVAQVWTGVRWGGMAIPRVGQEVIVDFLEGDPDRPIITGRVYNGVSMPPYELPANATMTTLKSYSSKGGGGFNEIRFEDKKGEEQIFIHAQKNQDIRVQNDRYEWIGQDRHLIVKKDKFEHVENNRNEIVDSDHLEKIGKDRHLAVAGKEAIEIGGSHSFTVKGDVIEVFKASHSEQTSGSYYLKATSIVIEALGGVTLKCGGSHVVVDPSGVTVKGAVVTIDGGLIKIASGPGSGPGSGSGGAAVPAAAPTRALEADKADPGEMAEVKAQQRVRQSGKYGKAPVPPFKPPAAAAAAAASAFETVPGPEETMPGMPVTEKKKSWIEIELVDEQDNPVPGEKYEITLPDGTVASGTLDEKGLARVDGIDPGLCQITFPELHRTTWKRK